MQNYQDLTASFLRGFFGLAPFQGANCMYFNNLTHSGIPIGNVYFSNNDHTDESVIVIDMQIELHDLEGNSLCVQDRRLVGDLLTQLAVQSEDLIAIPDVVSGHAGLALETEVAFKLFRGSTGLCEFSSGAYEQMGRVIAELRHMLCIYRHVVAHSALPDEWQEIIQINSGEEYRH